MPLPKGIYSNPAVRQAWVMERRAALDVFDRLTGEGVRPSEAARTIGVTTWGVQAMRDSVERLEVAVRTGRSQGERIDLGLALLSCLLRPGESLTHEDMAAWCGCSPAAIQRIEYRALRKLRGKLNVLLRGDVEHLFGREAA